MYAGCPVTSTRGSLRAATSGVRFPGRDRTSWAGSPVAILDPLRESELHRLFTMPSHFGSNIRVLFRRRARNAPDQVDERRAVHGCDLAGQLEAAPGTVVSAYHRAPPTESAECTEKVARELGPRSVAGIRRGDRWRRRDQRFPMLNAGDDHGTAEHVETVNESRLASLS